MVPLAQSVKASTSVSGEHLERARRKKLWVAISKGPCEIRGEEFGLWVSDVVAVPRSSLLGGEEMNFLPPR